MKVHVDINVFMDVLTQRAGWLESLAAIKILKPRGISGFVSALTMAIVYFQRLRNFGETQARTDAKFVTKDLEIIPLTRQIIFAAFDSPLPDCEDNIQFFSAKEMQVDYIITRNKKHFVQHIDERRVGVTRFESRAVVVIITTSCKHHTQHVRSIYSLNKTVAFTVRVNIYGDSSLTPALTFVYELSTRRLVMLYGRCHGGVKLSIKIIVPH